MEGDVIILQDLFRFEHVGLARGKVQGQLRSTGIRPKFETKLARNGVKIERRPVRARRRRPLRHRARRDPSRAPGESDRCRSRSWSPSWPG